MSQPTRPTETTDQKGDAKARYTPGPWTAVKNSAYWEIDGPDDFGTVADACASSAGEPDFGRSMALGEANARLIAAAPDMYTLIKAEYDANHGFETLPIGYSRERAEAISNIVKAVEGGAA